MDLFSRGRNSRIFKDLRLRAALDDLHSAPRECRASEVSLWQSKSSSSVRRGRSERAPSMCAATSAMRSRSRASRPALSGSSSPPRRGSTRFPACPSPAPMPTASSRMSWLEAGSRFFTVQMGPAPWSLSVATPSLAAITGAAGLPPVLEAARRGRRLCLSNKESLVLTGPILGKIARENGCELVPVDSEHSAIFQALQSGTAKEAKRLVLTASGGPFRTLDQGGDGGSNPGRGAESTRPGRWGPSSPSTRRP